MFTGIITDIGSILESHDKGDLQFKIGCNYSLSSITIGGSIAHDGICLTVTDKGSLNNSVDEEFSRIMNEMFLSTSYL